MPDITLGSNPSSHDKNLDDLAQALNSTTEKQFRFEDGVLGTKDASDRKSGSVRAALSGQKAKFSNAQKALERAYLNSTGLDTVPDEVKTLIQNGVTGGGGSTQDVLASLKQAAEKQMIAEYPKLINNKGVKGADLFKQIESLPFSDAVKQQMHCEVGRNIVKAEVLNAGGKPTFFRENTEGTKYMGAYMGKYASAYLKAATDQAVQEISGMNPPTNGVDGKPLGAGNMVRLGDINSLQQQSKDEWSTAFKNSGLSINKAMQDNANLLTPQAKEFISTCASTGRSESPQNQKDYAANIVTVNVVALRSVCPGLTARGAEFLDSTNPKTKMAGQLLVGGSIVTQSLCNAINKPDDEALDQSKPQNRVADLIRGEGQTNANLKSFVSGLENAGVVNVANNVGTGVQQNVPQQNVANVKVLPTRPKQGPPIKTDGHSLKDTNPELAQDLQRSRSNAQGQGEKKVYKSSRTIGQ